MSINDLLNNHYLSTLRNKAIANHFHMLGEIEKYGSGITRVITLFRDAGLEPPKFEILDGGMHVTIFAKKVADKEAVKVADKVANKKLSTEEWILQIIGSNPGCSVGNIMKVTSFSNSYIRKVLSVLSAAGKIEHRGSKKTGGFFPVK